MPLMQRTKIVVPCYNEANRLRSDAFASYAREQDRLSFLFVDDGSKDETYEVLQALARTAPESMEVLRLEKNSGKAEAVRRGVLAAFDAKPDCIGYWDADLATPLRYIEAFEEILRHPPNKLVLGSRVRLLGRQVERTAARHYLGRGFATVAGLALGLPIYDTQCGAKLFRAEPIFRAAFETPFELTWSFDVELLARLKALGETSGELDPATQFVEFPLEEWRDAPGSKLRPAHFPRIGLEVLRLFLIARRPPPRSP
jgi:glycosyltransferase involved in cell wall biosynthesis